MHIQESFTSWFHQHQNEFDAVVFDIDGVLVAGDARIPGSLEFTRILRSSQIPMALLTNDGNNSVAQKARRLARHGFDFTESEITSCSDGLVEAVQSLGCHGKLFFIIGDLGDPC